MVMLAISDSDRDRIAAAVALAEQASDGEIVTVIAPRSDAYHDVALHYAILFMLLVPAVYAVLPQSLVDWVVARFLGWNARLDRELLMGFLFVKLAGTFLFFRLLLAWLPLRMALTPRGTKARRVRRRAVEIFKAAVANRTEGRTGILLYLSLLERRAEIVADEAIHSRTDPEAWGAAMAALIGEVKAGRPGDGMALAVEKIGAVLADCLPARHENPNEISDRLIEL
jgi:putative membrane protein